MRPSIPKKEQKAKQKGKQGEKALPSVPYCLRLGFASIAAFVLVLALLHCGAEPTGEPTAIAEKSAAGAHPAAGASAKAPSKPAPAAGPREDTPVVLFLGTSITAGYGLPEDEAFPALIQEQMSQAGLDYRAVNAGVSGDTSAGGLRRLDWLLRMPVSVLVLELGANDMLRGQSPDQLKINLEAILDQTTERHPGVRFVIAGMRAAPNLGRDYGGAFDAVYPQIAERYEAALVPFLLEDVAAKRNLNQADGIHPTAEGHRLIAERLWPILSPVLR